MIDCKKNKFKSGLIIFIFCIISNILISQVVKKDSSDITFTGTKVNPYSIEYDTTGKVIFSGYLDTYYAGYSDTSNSQGYQKFPTAAPRNNQFGINILQISARYQSSKFRGVTTLFYGDSPQSAWSPYLNLIQEANLGFQITKHLWLDAGYFRTHLGLESIQPRENMAISFATTTYFEPYFLSGAKLTWEYSKKITFQVNAFNGFNTFQETNKNKAFGFSTVLTPNSKLNISYSTLICDESPINFPRNQLRSYSDLILIYKTHRLTLGAEINYGYQTNSKLKDTLRSAQMLSSLIAVKYRFTSKFASYCRGEIFSDPDEILTGPIINETHKYVGLDIKGLTLGLEFKVIPNSYLRVEGRALKTKYKDEKIFYYHGDSSNLRYEIIVGLGAWF
jgi:hypothetical protein